MADDYEELRDWMARSDVQAAVARQGEPDEEESLEPEQLAMRLDNDGEGGGGGDGTF